MKTVILVPGTWRGDWYEVGSPFRRFLEAHGLRTFCFRGWTGNVSGVPNVLAKSKHSDWSAGGEALGYKLEDLLPEDRIVLAHSHGGQPAAYCAAPGSDRAGVYIHRLVTVCTPARGDMDETWTAAHQNIGAHRHISAEGWDFWQRLGELGDNHWGWVRTIKGADNQLLDGIGHTGLLEEEKYFHYLTERIDGKAPALDFLQETGVAT